VLAAGGILALPTDTYYALAVHPFNQEALNRLFVLKQRPPGKPILLLVAHEGMVLQVAQEVPQLARRLMAKFWPGPLTIILPARPDLPQLVTGGTGTVGVRQPRHPVTCGLVAGLGFPVTGTSANRAGQLPLTQAAEVEFEFKELVDLILDAGPCPGGLPSTVVDVSCSPPRLVRPGGTPADQIGEIVPGIKR
jgi:L-threonylcarbamoyladenylate synthase